MAELKQISKTLSYWLRHRPDAAGLELDAGGWVPVTDVQAALGREGLPEDGDTLRQVVEENDKQRFEFSADGARIRARQGHSISVEGAWDEREPPEFLYHGTVEKVLPAIMAHGLRPMQRHHVHLSPHVETARRVGSRRGRPVILRVEAAHWRAAGHRFYLSANGVWLVDHVEPQFLTRLDED